MKSSSVFALVSCICLTAAVAQPGPLQQVPIVGADSNRPPINVPDIASGLDDDGLKEQKHSKHKKLTSEKIRRRLKKAGIIPTVINDFVPSFLLNITFENKHSPLLGRKIKPSKIPHAPNVALYSPPKRPKQPKITGHDNQTLDGSDLPFNNLVVVLTDPDAPSRKNPEWSEHCHWIAQGVPLTNLSMPQGDMSPPKPLQEIVPYQPPGPPPKTGKHRYVFLVFTPKNATTSPLYLRAPKDRKFWGYDEPGSGARRWAEEMGLLPIAADFFRSKHEK